MTWSVMVLTRESMSGPWAWPFDEGARARGRGSRGGLLDGTGQATPASEGWPFSRSLGWMKTLGSGLKSP